MAWRLATIIYRTCSAAVSRSALLHKFCKSHGFHIIVYLIVRCCALGGSQSGCYLSADSCIILDEGDVGPEGFAFRQLLDAPQQEGCDLATLHARQLTHGPAMPGCPGLQAGASSQLTEQGGPCNVHETYRLKTMRYAIHI